MVGFSRSDWCVFEDLTQSTRLNESAMKEVGVLDPHEITLFTFGAFLLDLSDDRASDLRHSDCIHGRNTPTEKSGRSRSTAFRTRTTKTMPTGLTSPAVIEFYATPITKPFVIENRLRHGPRSFDIFNLVLSNLDSIGSFGCNRVAATGATMCTVGNLSSTFGACYKCHKRVLRD
jgi:hypothetical protein